MKIKEGFVIREICGQNVVSGEGFDQVDFSKLLKLNDSASWLWQQIEDKEFSVETLTELICSNFEGVDREVATKDATNFCKKLKSLNIIEA